ncbi:hypothetical protein [Streptacidiphilus sp. EB129]|uniref:hypothetical protein n=1 Tax=Streptacidiphilus sp. EB129 TaxID=3156262 RepID=UPI0035173018
MPSAGSTQVGDPGSGQGPSRLSTGAWLRIRLNPFATGPGASPGALRRPPEQVNRMLTVLACSSMLIGARDVWNRTIINQHTHALAVILYFGAILVLGVLALSVRSRRAMITIDILVLAVAALECLNRFYTVTAAKPTGTAATSHVYYGTDEGSLVDMAARTLLHGGHMYGTQWPQIFRLFHVGTTPLMDGGAATGLDYPPLGPVFTAVPMALHLSHPPAGLAATAMLLVASVVMFLLLPKPWRPVAVIVCYGFGWLPSYAQMGYPGCMELPFLMVAVAYWQRTGRGGRLGRGGVARAVCLGIAVCLHQLTWFLAPFLVVGLFMIRRGEMSGRDAATVVGRYVAIVVGVAFAINLPFIVQDPSAWLRGVLTPLFQKAIPSGQGLVGISYYFRSGSGDLHLYSDAGLLLGLAMLILLIVFPRRLGLAVTIMPWLVFYLSTRSQEDYFDLTVPLWVLAAATVSAADFDQAWHPRRWLLRTRSRRALLVPVLLAPAMLCLVAAVQAPTPVTMRITSVSGSGGTGPLALTGLVGQIDVDVTNTTGGALQPHFATSTGANISDYWLLLRGPAQLAPHTTADYVLAAPPGGVWGPGVLGKFLLRVVTPNPMSLTTQLIGIGPNDAQIATAKAAQAAQAARAAQVANAEQAVRAAARASEARKPHRG